ncbi:MAG: hypothetical protein OEV49_15840 [candidate division Zixibacteria bacterium]|nr:hypothetical protein [candidate division Zixibacteria bacterium]MDH3937455.1 hypothetical protein [candidate division Zixibacteria bacterium]MDH4035058.1 hypothetical protein [candidate division Zixibacteria bacterium]
MYRFLDRTAKVVGILATLMAVVTYYFENTSAAAISLALACCMGIVYTTWMIVARIPGAKPVILGAENITYVARFSPTIRLVAAIATGIQTVAIVAITTWLVSSQPYFEDIAPTAPGESLVVVFGIEGPANTADITTAVASTLQAELEYGPTGGVVALMSPWRIEQSRRALAISDATALGKELRALFVITGSHDGQTLNLKLALTEPSLLILDEDLTHIGVRLDGSPISLNIPVNALSAHLLPVAIFIKGIHLYISGDVAGAKDHFSEVIDRSEDARLTARTHYLRGICHYIHSDADQADQDYDRAVELGLELPAVHWRRAELFLNENTGFSVVEEELKTAIELSRNSSESYYIAGLLTFEAMLQIPYAFADMPEFFDRADDYLRVSMEKDPSSHRPVFMRVSLYARYGDFLDRNTLREVSAFLMQAIDQGGDHADLRLALANVHSAYGQGAAAIQHLEKALDLGASRAAVQSALADVYDMTGDTSRAIESIQLFLAERGDQAGDWWQRAVAKARLASFQGGKAIPLFKTLDEPTEKARREKFSNVAASWIGKVWNRDFLGERSTEDFLLYLLTESNIIPEIADRESAQRVMRSLLARDNVEISSESVPLWCERGLWSGTFLIVNSPDTSGIVGIYLEPGPDGRVLEIEDDVVGLDFFFECHQIRTDIEIGFHGD